MIAEIGLIVGLYILTRLIPQSWRRLSAASSIVTAIVTVAVVTDLALGGLGKPDLASRIQDLFAQPAPTPLTTGQASLATPTPSTIQITQADGGSIVTTLGYGIAVAKGSSLRREWIAIHDSALPVDFDGTPGITTIYKSEEYSGKYYYQTKFTLKTHAAVTAIEARFLTFDVWGNHMQNLIFDTVEDIAADATKTENGRWNEYSENNVEAFYASIAYISRVRLKDGRVLLGDVAPVVAEAQKFSEKFTAADLQPKPTPILGRDKT